MTVFYHYIPVSATVYLKLLFARFAKWARAVEPDPIIKRCFIKKYTDNIV